MVLDSNLSISISYSITIFLSLILYKKKEAFILYHFLVIGFLEFESQSILMIYFSKFSLGLSLMTLAFPLGRLTNNGLFLEWLKRIVFGIIAPYLTFVWLLPSLHSSLMETFYDPSVWDVIVPLWFLVPTLLILKLDKFSEQSFFKFIAYFSVLTVILSAPVTLFFFLVTHRSFHRIREAEFYLIEKFQSWFLFLNKGELAPKIWFLVDAMCSYVFLISFLAYLACYAERGWKAKKFSVAHTFVLFGMLCLVLLWNYSTISLSVILVMLLLVLFLVLLSKTQSEISLLKKGFIVGGVILPLVVFSLMFFKLNQFNEKHFRFNSLQRKLLVRWGDFRLTDDNWLAYNPLGKQTFNNYSRVEKWYTQWVNLRRVGLFRGVGQPKNDIEKANWLNRLGLLSGHSKLFDDLMVFGLFTGTIYNGIFWIPFLILLFQLRKWHDIKFNHWLWLKWLFVFMGSFIVCVVGVWGEITLSIAIQLIFIALYISRLSPVRQIELNS